MNKITLLLITLLAITESTFGQVWTGSTTSVGCINHDGPVSMNSGSNTTTIGPAWFAGGSGTGYIGLNYSRNTCSGTSGLWTYNSDAVSGGSNGAAVIWGTIGGDVLFSCKPSTGSSAGTSTDNAVLDNIKMSIKSDGKVVIGESQWDYSTGWYTWEAVDYKLFVQGGIITDKVKVALKGSSAWPDYVFKKNYNMMPLAKVEEFINKNKHLPNVPSAQEVVDSGIDMATMDAKLLEKIEELTLYTIELNKKIAIMEKKLNTSKTKK